MATTAELVQDYQRIVRERRETQRQRDAFVRGKVDAYTVQVTREADSLYGSSITNLYATESAAQELMLTAKESDARAGIGGILPVGTVLHEWEYRKLFGHAKGTYRKTGRTARYIGVTRQTVLPANLTYHRPEVGEFILQLNKQNGAPGIALVTGSDRDDFYLEGADPNTDGVKSPFLRYAQSGRAA